MRRIIFIIFSLLTIPTVSSEIPGKGNLLVMEVNRFGNVDYLSSCLSVNYPSVESFQKKYKKFDNNKDLKCNLSKKSEFSFDCLHRKNGRKIYVSFHSDIKDCRESLAAIDEAAYSKRKDVYSQYKDGEL